MTRNLPTRIFLAGSATLLAAVSVMAQDHQWAGRTLDNLESAIHERLASLPSYGVFDTIRFEVQGRTITLTGQVVKEDVKQKAERAVRQIDGVAEVNNRIEVLPSSRRDDELRMNIYRAIYDADELRKYGSEVAPAIHIIVKNGWVSLEGVVQSDADREAAHFRALKVTAHVSDNLRVARDAQ